MSKILLPESETPVTLGRAVEPHYERDSNLFEAVINGSRSGVKVIFGIVALLIAVIGLVALVNSLLGWGGGLMNHAWGMHLDLSLQNLLGYLFYPLTVILGVPLADAGLVSGIIGERLVLTEVASYQHLAQALRDGALVHPRSAVITAYALCGFAHLASMAIFVGGITALVPERTRTISQVGFRALLAATLACLMTACVAGMFFMGEEIVLTAAAP
jgi:CNT family concentrative nucleoside transporter